jgi:hypothetical protein
MISNDYPPRLKDHNLPGGRSDGLQSRRPKSSNRSYPLGDWILEGGKSRPSIGFCDRPEEGFQDLGNEKPHLVEDETQIVAGGGQEGVDPVAIVANRYWVRYCARSMQLSHSRTGSRFGLSDRGSHPQLRHDMRVTKSKRPRALCGG